MNTRYIKTICLVIIAFVFPFAAFAQGTSGNIGGLHEILEQLYTEMLPLCSRMIDVGRAISGLGAMLYISYRVWGHIARAEAIDFYPLFRPFALGLVLTLYMPVISLFNSVLKPTVSITADMVKNSDDAVKHLLEEKERIIKETQEWKIYVGTDGEGNRDEWYKYTHPGESTDDEGMIESIGNDIKFSMSKMYYNIKNSIKQWMSEVLQVVFQAASLCIDTLRTFQLVVLAILGPLVIGLSVYDGFQQSLVQWIARYINVFLWLPIANLFGAIIGKVQEGMIKLDIQQLQAQGETSFGAMDTGYLIFMIIGIVGYFTVPSVANYVIHAHGSNGLLSKVNASVMGGTRMISSKR